MNISELKYIPFNIYKGKMNTFNQNQKILINKIDFDKKILTLPVKDFNNYIIKSKLSTIEINYLKITRRRHKNCIYSKKARLKKTHKSCLIDSIEDSIEDSIPNLIHYKNVQNIVIFDSDSVED